MMKRQDRFVGFLVRFLAFHFHSFLVQLCYFVILSLLGYLGLKFSKPRTPVIPNDLDLFYTSVSACTVSSMVAVQMESFSNSQLILLTLLMFLGGEVFSSMFHLVFAIARYKFQNRVTTNQVEASSIRLKYNCLSYLTFVVLGYLLVVQFVGFSFVSFYIALVPSARQVLKNKGIKIVTFSLFTVVSTFSSCGFVPTNENMMVFNKNSGLLLLLLPHVLLGNTLYAPCLRLAIMVLKKATCRRRRRRRRREEYLSYLLMNDVGCDHMLSVLHCCLLVATVLVLNLIQFVMLCSLEWNSMKDLNVYQKVVASFFQVTNARHAGESVFDISSISSPMLVLFIVMMYLPPYTTFLPVRVREKQENDVIKKRNVVECLVLSQLSYLVIFIILICITESKSLKEDPLNFNVLNITLEVISAYGNVGFSMGYSCARQLKEDDMCKDSWVGFSGRWNNQGKFILIFVMFFGRLKKFNIKGGNAWNLS